MGVYGVWSQSFVLSQCEEFKESIIVRILLQSLPYGVFRKLGSWLDTSTYKLLKVDDIDLSATVIITLRIFGEFSDSLTSSGLLP